MKMLYMEISTWEPEKRDLILEHFKELKMPAGVKVHDQWVDLTGGRYFILYECDDAEAFATFNLPWSDVCYIETVPVMKSTEFMSVMSKKS
jgi:uncharacterized protein DUF3303